MTVTGEQIIASAEQFTGVPYSQQNPQSTSTGFDCSGMVQAALANLGINIPRTTSAQLAAAVSGQVGQDIGTNLANAQPGDIIHYPGHEEVWLGNGEVFSEATYGTRAAVRGRDNAPIIGIVRYTGVPNGASNATLASVTTGSSSGSSLDPITTVENWASSVAMRVGMIVFGAILVIFGLVIALKDTGVGRSVKSGAKLAALAA